MAIDFLNWLNLIVRWAHIIAGIGWIGTSFYFVALDFSLRKESEHEEGVTGEAWQVHGGGFYHVKKFHIAPDRLPKNLIWYKWEAYLTWLTGFVLLIIQYYYKAEIYLIDPDNRLGVTPGMAVFVSISSLLMGWVFYDLICKSLEKKNALITAILVFVLIICTAKVFSVVFSGRGALIHVGAFIGTIMAVNVFGVIIPNQKKITASLIAGEKPDPNLGLISKQRSLHNNYLTLPVLLLMISNHYPILSNHEKIWLVIALIIFIGTAVRHLINRHEAGADFRSFIWALPAGVVALLILVIITAPRIPVGPPLEIGDTSEHIDRISDSRALNIIQTHCSSCHAPFAGAEEYFVAPNGIKLETISDLRRYRAQVKAQSVTTKAMPMGAATNMTNHERSILGQWIDQQ